MWLIAVEGNKNGQFQKEVLKIYDYNEYLEHLDLTKKYEKKVANYKLTTNNYQTFRNIQILFCGKEWVMISKISSPSIHFVIHHPKLRDAIENFIPPVVEK